MYTPDSCVFLLVDVQKKLTPYVANSDDLIKNCAILLKAAQILKIPILWLEQYPKGLGKTVEPLQEILTGSTDPVEKIAFSGCFEDECKHRLFELNRKHCVVMGIEAHVCVYQTVMDLIDYGKTVQVVHDAVSSRASLNKEISLQRMQQRGALITTVEMILFELLRGSKHEHFKAIQALIK